MEAICANCPLDGCDEEHLFCAMRWASNPNAQQLKVATFRVIPKRLTSAERSRRWREKNPERYAGVRKNYRERVSSQRSADR